MSSESGWAKRVEAATAGTMHEQLRTLTQEAREALAAVSETVRDQGATLADVSRRTADIAATVAASLERLRDEMAADRRSIAEELAQMRATDRASLAETGTATAAELRRIADGFTDSLEIMRSEVEAFSERIRKHTDDRIDGLRADVDRMITTLAEQVEADTDRLHTELSGGIDAITARIAALEDDVRRAVQSPARRTDDGVSIAFG